MKKYLHFFLISLLLFASGMAGFFFAFYQDKQKLQNHATLTIQNSHTPLSFVEQIKGDPDAGRKIFKEFCAACHDKKPLIDINAPRKGDKKTWENLRRRGMDQLLKITIQGIKAMPARGGCFECSDEQLREAIEYLSH